MASGAFIARRKEEKYSGEAVESGEKKGGRKEIDKIMRDVGAKINIMGIRRMGGENEIPGVWVVKFESETGKWKVIR